ncbi:unnamed protein product [Brassica rapa]|uniref:Uncharacterized protein n=2 Tax=Brassica TaxID=3705 RepID=A0A8D9MDI6_BRACM|nr:unnamed protein product [Brassica napus]CAG7907676.1 unnamed protein product [Brassica rapa]
MYYLDIGLDLDKAHKIRKAIYQTQNHIPHFKQDRTGSSHYILYSVKVQFPGSTKLVYHAVVLTL